MAEPKDSSLQFFSKANAKQWSYILSLYKDVLKLKAEQRSSKKGGPEELIKLDTWFQEQLPKIIHSRKDPHINHEELVQIMKWKLMRGKFRPRLIDLVRINTETSVLQTSKKAFRKLYHQKNLAQAISALVTLKGIGPATASAVLAAGFPEHAPYMADESMLSTPGVEGTDYTLAEYINYAEQIKACVERLKASDAESKWTPHKIEMALWTHYLAREMKPSLLDGMPSPNGSPKSVDSVDNDEDEEESNEGSAMRAPTKTTITPTITITSSTAVANELENYQTKGKLSDFHSDDNSLSGPSSELEDKSEDSSSLLNLMPTAINHGNGTISTTNTEDSKDFNSAEDDSEENNISRNNLLMPPTDNSNDNAVDGEPAFKKQRTELSSSSSSLSSVATTAAAVAASVAIGEDL